MSLHFPFKKSLEISGYGKTAFMSIIEKGVLKVLMRVLTSIKTRLRYGNQKYLSGTIY